MILGTNKKAIFVLVTVILVAVGGLWGYAVFQEETIVQDNKSDTVNSVFSDPTDLQFPGQEEKSSVTEPIQPFKSEEEISELISTESVVCGDETYIFNVVLNRFYFSNIYKTSRLPENLFFHEQSSGKEGNPFGALSVLSVPKQNCDRIYLTRVSPYGGVSTLGIYEWIVGENSVREILSYKDFHHTFLPSRFDGKKTVSPDGERVIVVQREDSELSGCNARILKLFSLREHQSDVLVRLPQDEIFDLGTGGEEGYCSPDFGWIDESTIYYDVYIHSPTTVGVATFLERRTLKIQ